MFNLWNKYISTIESLIDRLLSLRSRLAGEAISMRSPRYARDDEVSTGVIASLPAGRQGMRESISKITIMDPHFREDDKQTTNNLPRGGYGFKNIVHSLSSRPLLLIGILFIIIVIPIVFLVNKYSNHEVSAAWYDDTFQYRKPIDITNNTSAESNVYVGVTVDSSDTTRFQTDCGDIRFTKFNGEKLPYYISSGCATASTILHVFLNTFPAGKQTIYYYYGNANAPNGFNSSDFATQASNYTLGSTGSEEKTVSPVAYWKFDEGVGSTVYDSSIQGNNGSLGTGSSAPTWQTEDQCMSGKCLFFDGSNDYINTNKDYSWSNSQSYTISTWFKTPSNTDKQVLFGKGVDNNGWEYRLYFQADSTLVWTYWDTSGSGADSVTMNLSATNVSINRWHHVEVTYDGSVTTGKMYLDGQLVSTDTSFGGTAQNRALNSSIGRGYYVFSDSPHYFKGYMDDFKIYNYSRTADQTKADYASGLAHAASNKGTSAVLGSNSKNSAALSDGLVGYWKMDESSGNAVDSSGNSNTLTNNLSIGYSGGKFGNASTYNGSTQYFSIGSTVSNVQTISFWVNPASNTNSYMNLNASTYITSSSGTVSATGVTSPLTYVNGVLNASITASVWNHVVITTATAITGSNFEVGRANGSYLSNTSKIDDVRVYNRALSPLEVQTLYNFAPGPLGYWDFNEGSGSTVYDSSGYGTNLTWQGGNSWALGKFGKAGSFNQTDNFYTKAVDPSLFDIASNLTLSAWIYPIANNTGNTLWSIVEKTDSTTGYALGMDTPNSVYCVIYTTVGGYTVTSTSNLPLNSWSFTSCVYNGSTLSLYINGVFNNSTAATGTILSPTGYDFVIGASNNQNQLVYVPFLGKIDEVKVYSYARSQKQMIEDMLGSPKLVSGGGNGGTVGYWKFDEGVGGTAYDSSSQGNNASLGSGGSAPTWTASGKFGRALSFDGVDDYVNIGTTSGLNTTGSISLSAWIKTSGTNDYSGILEKWNSNNGYQFGFDTSGAVRADFGNGTTYITPKYNQSNVEDGNWHHVVATYDGSTAKIYVDSVVGATTASGTGYVTASSVAPVIGNDRCCGNARHFNGTIDEVKIYPYALTADEVKLDYNHGSTTVLGSFSTLSSGSAPDNSSDRGYCVPGDTSTCSAPVAEWNFNEGVGTSAYDRSGNGYNGALTNGPTWTTGKFGKAVKLDGTNDNITMGDILKFTQAQAATVSVWFNVASFANNYQFLASRMNTTGTRTDYALILSNSTTVSYAEDDSSQIDEVLYDWTVPTISTGSWHNFTVVMNTNTSVDGYLDGRYLGNITSAPHADYGSTNFFVGEGTSADNGAGGITGQSDFNGKIDTVRVYNYARTAAQVAWDYNYGAPVGWWKMDEGQGGTLYDSSGIGNTGTITIGSTGTQTSAGTTSTSGTAWYNGATGKYNYSLNFDGTDDYVSLAGSNSLNIAGPITISSWVKTSTSGKLIVGGYNSTSPFAGYGFGIGVGTCSSGLLCYWSGGYGSWVSGTKSVTDNNWHNVVVTVNGSTATFYFDGFLDTIATSAEPNSYTSTRVIGGRSDGSFLFNGQIDDVKIYNYALTSVQVKQLYNQGGALRFGPSTGSP